jgi:hypothetical protein
MVQLVQLDCKPDLSGANFQSRVRFLVRDSVNPSVTRHGKTHMNRRKLVAFTLPLGIVLALGAGESSAYDNPRRRLRHRVRIRHRFRRRAFTRVMFGRPFWVVPMGLAVGWELVHSNRVVVVREIKVVEREGQKTEVAVVQDAEGKREEIEITRQDSAENSDELPGSEIAEDDTDSPGIESAPR